MNRLSVWGKKQLGKGRERGKGGGGGGPVDKHPEAPPEAAFPPSCNYPADHQE